MLSAKFRLTNHSVGRIGLVSDAAMKMNPNTGIPSELMLNQVKYELN